MSKNDLPRQGASFVLLCLEILKSGDISYDLSDTIGP